MMTTSHKKLTEENYSNIDFFIIELLKQQITLTSHVVFILLYLKNQLKNCL